MTATPPQAPDMDLHLRVDPKSKPSTPVSARTLPWRGARDSTRRGSGERNALSCCAPSGPWFCTEGPDRTWQQQQHQGNTGTSDLVPECLPCPPPRSPTSPLPSPRIVQSASKIESAFMNHSAKSNRKSEFRANLAANVVPQTRSLVRSDNDLLSTLPPARPCVCNSSVDRLYPHPRQCLNPRTSAVVRSPERVGCQQNCVAPPTPRRTGRYCPEIVRVPTGWNDSLRSNRCESSPAK